MSETTRELKGNQYRVTHTVGQNQSGIRLDRFLMQRYRRRSREQLKKAVDSGAITVIREGSPHLTLGKLKPSTALQGGDIVQVLSIRRPEPEVNFNYSILFEDDEIVVVNKPPNLPVHPAGRFFFNTLLTHLKTQGFKKDLKSELIYFLVHRIDKETSGVLLLAKTREACNILTSQFKNRETQKYYLAIVKGEPQKDSFTIDDPIGKIPKGKVGLKMYKRTLEEGGLPSLTHFEKIETRTSPLGTFTLMACFPRTGRQHQIRIHAEIAGYPLVGDKIYGMSENDVLALLDRHRDAEADAAPEDEPVANTEDSTAAPADESDEIEAATSDDARTPMETSAGSESVGDFDSPAEESFHIPGPTSQIYAELEARLLLPRHALHAAGLKFKHPRTGQEMVFEADLPDDLKGFFENLTQTPLMPFHTQHW